MRSIFDQTLTRSAALVVLTCGIALGAGPATQPSTSEALTHCVQLLSNRDPAQREIGREGLMGISRSDVDALRSIVATGKCGPGQMEAIQSAVIYVVTRANLNVTATAGTAFLGLSFTPFDDLPEVDPTEFFTTEGVGGTLVYPLPGFVGARSLRDDDLVLGLGAGKEYQQTPTREQFTNALKNYSAGTTITLHILRGAEILDIQLTLDRRPDDAEDSRMLLQRIAKAKADAETYWKQDFQPAITTAVR